jgi:hypothetical protein
MRRGCCHSYPRFQLSAVRAGRGAVRRATLSLRIAITDLINSYVDVHRQILCRGEKHAALWISSTTGQRPTTKNLGTSRQQRPLRQRSIPLNHRQATSANLRLAGEMKHGSTASAAAIRRSSFSVGTATLLSKPQIGSNWYKHFCRRIRMAANSPRNYGYQSWQRRGYWVSNTYPYIAVRSK